MVGGGEVSNRNASQEVESFGCAKMRLEYLEQYSGPPIPAALALLPFTKVTESYEKYNKKL